jgi:hypothetical protein
MDKISLLFFKISKGLTLLEVIIAIFIITVGIIGIFSLITYTISSASFAKDNLIAAYLAQEGIEIVRNIRDTNWLEAGDWFEGFENCATGCEVDYYCTTVEDPNSANPALHNCLASYDGGHFLKIDANNFYNYAVGTETKFKRKITITDAVIGGPVSGNSININVKVEVFWQEKGNNYSFEAQENLYNWYK